MKPLSYLLSCLALILLFAACKKQETNNADRKLKVVATTTMLTDLLKEVGGENIELEGLMGSGVDPHLYKANEGDVNKLFSADMIFYNGLHLEGKLADVFKKMNQTGKKTIPVAEALDTKKLIGSDYFASNYDPHIWFNINYWKKIANHIALELAQNDSINADSYKENSLRYIQQLDSLQHKIQELIAPLPPEKRILVTAHDAFNYFGEAFGFGVVGLQGLSTATEAGVKDVQELTAFILEKKIKAVFIESSVPRRTIEALQAAVRARGHEVKIGGTLYSDALGSKGTPEGTYLGMFEYNVKTIVDALR